MIFGAFGIFKLKESNDIFQQGLRLMAMIGFVMIAASGFANVINSTSGVKELVDALSTGVIQSKGVAAFLMLLVGLLITMGLVLLSQPCQLSPQSMYHFVSLLVSHHLRQWLL